MKLDLLETFVVTINTGSIHGAAKEMGQSQPSISKKLKLLEESLGVPLLIRGTQGIEITNYGKTFLIRAQAILNEARRAEAEMMELRGEKESTVRMIVAPTSTINLMPKTIQVYRQQHPHIKLEIYEGLQAMAVDQLRRAHVDFAVCPLWEELPANEFMVEEIENMPMAVVTRKGSRFAGVTKFRDLHDANWIHIGAGENLSPLVLKIFSDLGLDAPKPMMESYSLTTTLSFLSEYDSIALVPEKLVNHPVYSGWLTKLNLENDVDHYPLYIIRRRETPLTPSAESFCHTLARVAAQTDL
ncbi:LysR family transcriptional regulator [Reinekea blandensis]|nr:LysR family transcriptional regulator [Reinekea blandensis]